jgi:hypothetical protein
MPWKRPIDEIQDDLRTVDLRLPVPERDIIISSKHIADSALQDRIKNTPSREVISFTFDELEDLHRGLAFDANQTDEKKREKTIRKVLHKIEDFLAEEDDFDETELTLDDFENDLPIPGSPQQLFDGIFGGDARGFAQAPPCRVMLTAAHREALRSMDTLSLDIHKVVAIESQDELEFDFSPRQVLVTSLAIKEVIDRLSDEEDKGLVQPCLEIAQRISDALLSVIEDTAELDAEQRYRQSQASPVKVAYQLKITLDGSKPPIWRRLLVADCTLDVLHQVIQIAMGWTNSHLHLFEYDEDRFSDPRFEPDWDDESYDETQVFLSQLIADGCEKLRYWYDFGDDWWHTIKIEKTFQPKPTDKFPICVKGVGACPPEDCGGIWGYYEFLDAVGDPKHKRHDEFVEWAGEDYDPNHFDSEERNAALAHGPGEGFAS